MCVCCEEGKASDKWLSFGPEELFTNTCFIFSAQEGKCVYIYVYVRVCEGGGGGRIKKQIANLELHSDNSQMRAAEDGDLKYIGI